MNADEALYREACQRSAEVAAFNWRMCCLVPLLPLGRWPLAFDRGPHALNAAGGIGVELGQALTAEARRSIDLGAFYGSITFVSGIAERLS
jgi:hypothetical protein